MALTNLRNWWLT